MSSLPPANAAYEIAYQRIRWYPQWTWYDWRLFRHHKRQDIARYGAWFPNRFPMDRPHGAWMPYRPTRS